jgi:hypothetical protein
MIKPDDPKLQQPHVTNYKIWRTMYEAHTHIIVLWLCFPLPATAFLLLFYPVVIQLEFRYFPGTTTIVSNFFSKTSGKNMPGRLEWNLN